jgi:hypothetical protein
VCEVAKFLRSSSRFSLKFKAKADAEGAMASVANRSVEFWPFM